MTEFETEALRLLAVIAENTKPVERPGSDADKGAAYAMKRFSPEQRAILRRVGN